MKRRWPQVVKHVPDYKFKKFPQIVKELVAVFQRDCPSTEYLDSFYDQKGN